MIAATLWMRHKSIERQAVRLIVRRMNWVSSWTMTTWILSFNPGSTDSLHRPLYRLHRFIVAVTGSLTSQAKILSGCCRSTRGNLGFVIAGGVLCCTISDKHGMNLKMFGLPLRHMTRTSFDLKCLVHWWEISSFCADPQTGNWTPSRLLVGQLWKSKQLQETR